MIHFLNLLDQKCTLTFYSTVTIKSEFLDFRRRQHLTEGLLDLVDEVSKGQNLTPKSKAIINYKKRLLKNRKHLRTRENELPVEDETDIELDPSRRLFYDIEIKDIKKTFRARNVQKEIGWIKVCETYLKKISE